VTGVLKEEKEIREKGVKSGKRRKYRDRSGNKSVTFTMGRNSFPHKTRRGNYALSRTQAELVEVGKKKNGKRLFSVYQMAGKSEYEGIALIRKGEKNRERRQVQRFGKEIPRGQRGRVSLGSKKGI